jgi:hypothetical protein
MRKRSDVTMTNSDDLVIIEFEQEIPECTCLGVSNVVNLFKDETYVKISKIGNPIVFNQYNDIYSLTNEAYKPKNIYPGKEHYVYSDFSTGPGSSGATVVLDNNPHYCIETLNQEHF